MDIFRDKYFNNLSITLIVQSCLMKIIKIIDFFIITMKRYLHIYTLLKDLALIFELKEIENFDLVEVFFSCNPLFIDSTTFTIKLSRKT